MIHLNVNGFHTTYSNISYENSIVYTVIFLTDIFYWERIYRRCNNRYQHICRSTDHISSHLQIEIPANWIFFGNGTMLFKFTSCAIPHLFLRIFCFNSSKRSALALTSFRKITLSRKHIWVGKKRGTSALRALFAIKCTHLLLLANIRCSLCACYKVTFRREK